jgi:hypothetical protein
MFQTLVANISRFVSITWVGDMLTKVLALALVVGANIWGYQVWGGDKSEDNVKKIAKLVATLDNLEASKRRGANTGLHITSQQLVSRKELYDIIGVGLENFHNSDVVSTTVDKVLAQEAGLVDYQATPLYAYKVHVVIQGIFHDLAKFYTSIEQRYTGKVLWNEVVFDSTQYPKNQGAISFYVLAK